MDYRSRVTKAFLGAEIPNFRRFPFRATQSLRLYRAFWKVLRRLPPEDHTEAKYKLRDGFRRTRGVVSPKAVAKCLQSGYSQLEHWKSIVESQEVRRVGAWQHPHSSSKDPIDFSAPGDEVWEKVRVKANATIPGLVVPGSLPVTEALKMRLREKKMCPLYARGT